MFNFPMTDPLAGLGDQMLGLNPALVPHFPQPMQPQQQGGGNSMLGSPTGAGLLGMGPNGAKNMLGGLLGGGGAAGADAAAGAGGAAGGGLMADLAPLLGLLIA